MIDNNSNNKDRKTNKNKAVFSLLIASSLLISFSTISIINNKNNKTDLESVEISETIEEITSESASDKIESSDLVNTDLSKPEHTTEEELVTIEDEESTENSTEENDSLSYTIEDITLTEEELSIISQNPSIYIDPSIPEQQREYLSLTDGEKEELEKQREQEKLEMQKAFENNNKANAEYEEQCEDLNFYSTLD